MGDFTPTCDLYDRVYASKDYRAEAEAVVRIIRREHPMARSLLDVACGTGSHHPYLAQAYETLDGVDLEPDFVTAASRKNPHGTYSTGDMCEFDLGRKYDAVTCLFSSIGYVRSVDRLSSAVRQMALHVAPGGVLLVEPWFTPDAWKVGNVQVISSAEVEPKVVRMMHSSREGDVAVLRGEYLIGSSSGIERRTDQHELGLFTVEQMHGAFQASGLMARYEVPGLTGRGVYIARRGKGTAS